MSKLIGIFATAILLTLGAGLAQDNAAGGGEDTAGGAAFAAYDVNGDEQIDQSELTSSPLFSTFDADASGSIDENEFDAGVFALLDTDGSGALSESELEGLGGWTTAELGLADLDADANGEVSVDEFVQGYSEASAFSTFDADSSGDMSEAEFVATIFDQADDNDDGAISADEFTPRQYLFTAPALGSEDGSEGVTGGEGMTGGEGVTGGEGGSGSN